MGIDTTALIGNGSMEYNNMNNTKKDKILSYPLNFFTQLESLWISPKKRANLHTNLKTSFYESPRDIRIVQERISDSILAYSYTVLENQFSYKISMNKKFIFNMINIHRNVGIQNQLEFGIDSNEVGFTLGETIPSDNLPNWFESSRKCIYLKIYKNFKPENRIIFDIERVDDESGYINSWLTFSMLFH